MASPSYSVTFNGSSQYLTTPSTSSLAPGTGNFTYEAWIYPTSVTAIGSAIISSFVQLASPGDHGILLAISSTNTIFGQIKQDNSTALTLVTAGTYSLNQWYHVVFTRVNSTTSLFVNGIRASTGTSTINSTESTITIGKQYISGTVNMLFGGYISNARVVVGGTQPYDPSQTTITIPTSPLIAIANTALLTCNASTIIDNSSYNLSITATGSPTVSTFCAFIGGLGKKRSISFNGTNQYLRLADNLSAFNFGTGDFTEECWFYTTQVASNVSINSMFVGGTSVGSGFTVRSDLGGTVAWTSGNTDVYKAPISINTWYHVAYSRRNGTGRFFVNGTQQTASADTLNYSSNSWNVIGTWVNSAIMYFTGNISNFRAIKGVALYTASFSTPTSPLNAITNTVLLSNYDDNINDGSTNNFPITASNSPTVSDFSPFFQGSIKVRNTVPLTYGAYFPTLSSYMYTPVSSVFDPGATGAWTLEMWVLSPAGGIFYSHGNGGVWGVAINCYLGSGKFTFKQANGSSADVVNISSTNTFDANAWHHFVVSKDGSNVIRMFVDGNQEATVTYSGAIAGGSNSRIILNGIYDNNGLGQYGGSNNRLSNVRWVKGTAVYTSNFTPPTRPLGVIANTQLLTANASTFIDSSANNFTLTTAGTPTLSATNTPFGDSVSSKLKIRSTINPAYSVSFNGSTQYLTATRTGGWLKSANNFTLECWVYFTRHPSAYSGIYNTCIAGTLTSSSDGWEFEFTSNNSGAGTTGMVFSARTGTTPSGMGITKNFNTNTWYHIALVRSGTTMTIYVDGVSAGSGTISSWNEKTVISIGRLSYSPYFYYFPGYISNFRIVDGTAIYTSDFVPPLEQLSPVTNTAILTCNAPTIVDASSNNYTITNNGTATVSNSAVPILIDARTKLKIYSVT